MILDENYVPNHMILHTHTVEPMNYGHLGPIISVLIIKVILYDKHHFGTITKYVDYAGFLILKCLVTMYTFDCGLHLLTDQINAQQ